MKKSNKVNVNDTKLNMNLQLLADEGEQEPPQDANNETGGPVQQPPMSQDELNKLVEEKAKEMAKDIASRNIVKEKRKYKEMLESLQNDKAQLESEKFAKAPGKPFSTNKSLV